MNNLYFWDAVEKTDPQYTKNAKVGGQNRTSVDAQHKKKMITKAFGMYGLDWGVVAGSENYQRTHFEGSTCILDYKATAFYIYKERRAEFPIASQIKEAYITNGGKGYLKIDDEAIKKVRTDALTKGFTDVGFCADIHMGKFDDQDYVRGVAAEKEIEKAELREEEAKKKYEEIKTYVLGEIESISKVFRIEQAEKAVARVIEKVRTRCAPSGISTKGFEHLLNKSIEDRKNAK